MFCINTMRDLVVFPAEWRQIVRVMSGAQRKPAGVMDGCGRPWAMRYGAFGAVLLAQDMANPGRDVAGIDTGGWLTVCSGLDFRRNFGFGLAYFPLTTVQKFINQLVNIDALFLKLLKSFDCRAFQLDV